MYILIFEDGSMVKSETVGAEDLAASEDGLLDIIDCSSDNPTRYWDGDWISIEDSIVNS